MMGDGTSDAGEWAHAGAAPQATFVVRMWSTGLSGMTRGHVQHVRSRRSAYFINQQRLLTFMQEHLRAIDAAAHTPS